MNNFNWSIVGTGHAASKFVKDLGLLPNHSVSHVTSSSQARAEVFKRQLGLDAKVLSHSEITSIEGADAVYIGTHSNQHFKHVSDALALEIPILCEKPLALKLTEVEELYTLAAYKEVPLIEGLWTLFLPGLLQLETYTSNLSDQLNWVMDAQFGKQFSYDPSFRLFSKDKSGGSLYDLGIYPIAIATFFLGSLTLKQIEIQRSASGLVLDFQAVLQGNGNSEARVRGSIVENLSNTLTLRAGLSAFEIEAPFIGNSNISLQSSAGRREFFSRSNCPGFGLWKEAEFVEQIAANPRNTKLNKLREISVATHRILNEINSMGGKT